MTDWLSDLVGLPAEYLKTLGTVLGGAFLALGTYVVARIKEARRGPDPVLASRASPSIPPTGTWASRSSGRPRT